MFGAWTTFFLLSGNQERRYCGTEMQEQKFQQGQPHGAQRQTHRILTCVLFVTFSLAHDDPIHCTKSRNDRVKREADVTQCEARTNMRR